MTPNSKMEQILQTIFEINPSRNVDNLDRRVLKLCEEAGEVCEAYLSATSRLNQKNKTWCDVREEVIDALIVCIDILYTEVDELQSKKEFDEELIRIFSLKMEKWRSQIDAKRDVTCSSKKV